jgi:formylglycine-generating enzyme
MGSGPMTVHHPVRVSCPASSAEGREDHPVVHVAYEDVGAYANWAGRRLPTEAEWEAAARGGLDQTVFTWGDERERAGDRLANFWHGDFPWRPDSGYGTTTPVGSFPPNGYGLYDMAGNVWDWTAEASDVLCGACELIKSVLRARRAAC